MAYIVSEHHLFPESPVFTSGYYQISVNASILSDSGGSCVCTRDDLCLNDLDYLTCKNEVRNNLITATAAISALSTTLMGLFANLPVGLAPGLGLNAYVSSEIHGCA
jgi:adenine/guanine/hypoxanthine permease